MLSYRPFLLTLIFIITLCACTPDGASSSSTDAGDITAAETTTPSTKPQQARVSGTINATAVELVNAEYDGDLSIYTSDGWAFSPSLLIFLFRHDQQSPVGMHFSVTPDDPAASQVPHIHYRWEDPQTQAIEVDVAADHYFLELQFNAIEGDYLHGTIDFAVPGEETAVSGSFRARIKQ